MNSKLLCCVLFLSLVSASSATRWWSLWRLYYRRIQEQQQQQNGDSGSSGSPCPEDFELVGDDCLHIVEGIRGVKK